VISSLYRFIGICLLICPLAGIASAQPIHKDKHSIKAQLKVLVKGGMTIDEAVAQSIKVAPHNGEIITKTALSIYKDLPKTACAMRAKDGGMRFAVWPDFKACGDRIVRAAIKAGADPAKVTAASAAGQSESKQTSNRSARNIFGIDLYVLRQMFIAGMN